MVRVPGTPFCSAGTTGLFAGHPGILQPVIVQGSEWSLVKVIEVAPGPIVPPLQISIISSPERNLTHDYFAVFGPERADFNKSSKRASPCRLSRSGCFLAISGEYPARKALPSHSRAWPLSPKWLYINAAEKRNSLSDLLCSSA